MTHLEQLLAEFYDWKGYLVKRNIKVGRRIEGGWDMELDIVGYHPKTDHLVHIEASLDAHSWLKREERYLKKFAMGEKYILDEVFNWLPATTSIERIAIFPSCPDGRTHVAGAKLVSIDGFMKIVRDAVLERQVVARDAIPEQYPLLRTLQLAVKGYYRVHA